MAMHLYQVYPLKTDGRRFTRWDVLCESDHEALRFASWILATDFRAEVWRERSLIGTITGRHHWCLGGPRVHPV